MFVEYTDFGFLLVNVTGYNNIYCNHDGSGWNDSSFTKKFLEALFNLCDFKLFSTHCVLQGQVVLSHNSQATPHFCFTKKQKNKHKNNSLPV